MVSQYQEPNHSFDKLLANSRFTREFRDTSLLCFSETWFIDKKVTDESVAIDGFGEPYRMDRGSTQTGKEATCACMSVRSFVTGPV